MTSHKYFAPAVATTVISAAILTTPGNKVAAKTIELALDMTVIAVYEGIKGFACGFGEGLKHGCTTVFNAVTPTVVTPNMNHEHISSIDYVRLHANEYNTNAAYIAASTAATVKTLVGEFALPVAVGVVEGAIYGVYCAVAGAIQPTKDFVSDLF